jgi:hypothetical protein
MAFGGKKRKTWMVLILLGFGMMGLLFFSPVGLILGLSGTEFKLRHLTDHARLLAACRTVLANPKQYRAHPYIHGASDDTCFPDPSDPQMPPEIRSLGCSYITIREKTMNIEMGGGFHHYGFFVPADGEPARDKTELVKGLYFYSE